MIKDNQKTLNRLHVVLDALFIVVTYSLVWLIMISGKAVSYTHLDVYKRQVPV